MKDTIGKIMIRRVITCGPESNLQDAAKIMRGHKIGSLVVKKDGKPIGIITERDMVYKAVSGNLDLLKTTVKEIMSSPIISVTPEEKVYYANTLLHKAGIKKLPVIKNGKLVGIITHTDLIGFFNKMKNLFVLDKFGKSIKSV